MAGTRTFTLFLSNGDGNGDANRQSGSSRSLFALGVYRDFEYLRHVEYDCDL